MQKICMTVEWNENFDHRKTNRLQRTKQSGVYELNI